MELPQQALAEVKALYKEEFGEEISDEEADEIGTRLLDLFSLLRRPRPEHRPESARATAATLGQDSPFILYRHLE